MYYEEALGIGRHLTPLQRSMLLDIDNWNPATATPYNRDELIWKLLIELSPCGTRYLRTERGEEVAAVANLKATPDQELLLAWHRCDVDSWMAERIIREIEDRQLDF